MKVLISVSSRTRSLDTPAMLKKKRERMKFLAQQKLVKELREKFRSTKKNVFGPQRETAVTKANAALQRAIDKLDKMKATMKG